MQPPPIATVADAIAAAQLAYDSLVELAEEIEDEWSYVNDLATSWRQRLDEVQARHGLEPTRDGVAAAVDLLTVEASAIADPHRAIDWLSTFPQVLLVALAERP